MFVPFLTPDFYHLHKVFASNNRVTVAGGITREKVVTCFFSFFHSIVVRHPLNFTCPADSKAGFFYQQGL